MRGAYAWDVEDQVFFSKLTRYIKNCDLNTNICPDSQCWGKNVPCCFLITNLKLHCLSKLLENMTYTVPLNYWVTPVMLAFDSLPWKGIMLGVELNIPVMNNFALYIHSNILKKLPLLTMTSYSRICTKDFSAIQLMVLYLKRQLEKMQHIVEFLKIHVNWQKQKRIVSAWMHKSFYQTGITL